MQAQSPDTHPMYCNLTYSYTPSHLNLAYTTYHDHIRNKYNFEWSVQQIFNFEIQFVTTLK